jgi:hypothetical protein
MEMPDRTVFVLGAGASVPYHFPSGRKLLNWTIQQCRDGGRSFALDRQAQTDVSRFGSELAASGATSLDQFVLWRKQYSSIAKAAIAANLLSHETDANVCPGIASNVKAKSDWLGYLLESLLNSGPEGLRKIRIVTFNFDRVIERRVFKTLVARFGLDESEAARKVADLSIVHVNGTLGRPAWLANGSSGLRWEVGAEPDAIHSAMSTIQFVHEERARRDVDASRQAIQEARLVCFLGFGFHPENLAALGLSTGSSSAPHTHPVLAGSAYGFTYAETREIEMRIVGPSRLYHMWDALEFCRRCPNLHGYDDHFPGRPWSTNSVLTAERDVAPSQ